jgi:ATP-binding cassette, subfamily B, bacterial PglK
MIDFLSKFFYILEGKYKSISFMLSLFLLTSFLEVIGIGMVGPFIALATNPGAIRQNPWLGDIYTKLHLTSEIQFLQLFGIAVIVLFYIKAFLNFSAQKYIFEFGFGQQAMIASRLMKAYLSAPYTFHLDRNSANLIQNINNETERFANGLMMPLLSTISNSIIIIALAFLLVKTNAMAMLIIGGVLLFAFLIVYGLKDRLKRWGEEGSDARTQIIRSINHGLGGLKETKVIGCESYFEVEMQKQAHKFGKSAALAVSFSNLPRFMIEAFLVTFLIIFTVLFVTSLHGSSQDLSAVLGIFALASIRLLPAISNVFTSINGIRYSAFSLNQIYSDLKNLENARNKQLEFSASKASPTQNRKKITFDEKICLESVTYQYPNSAKTSLKEISLTIKKGQSIGLVGKSGAGKTTLVDVILGLLIPQEGDILVDGQSVYQNIRDWQDLIGYVPQSIFLIDDTLERNIAFGVPDSQIDRNRLQKAIEAAQLIELVEQLSNGLETMVGERGVLLSGGQRQRVGIARALYHEREVLVFDEATAALDNETEALVTEAIKSLIGTKTIVIIAHRLTTIKDCDVVYRLERGKIVQSGTYEDVC